MAQSHVIREPSLPATTGRRLLVVFSRALRRRCPYCSGPGIFGGWWTLHDQCPSCGISYNREEGYFLGAYAINLVVAEFFGLGLVVAMLIWSNWATLTMQITAVVLAIGLPLLVFPYSRTCWIALDLMLHPPSAKPHRQPRRDDQGT